MPVVSRYLKTKEVNVMWTNEELVEIRDRAELEASIRNQNLLWASACLNLAASASHLLSITDRICQKELTAICEYDKGFKPSTDPKQSA